jgi:drug/metabolite transporter (DMT)-like permease
MLKAACRPTRQTAGDAPHRKETMTTTSRHPNAAVAPPPDSAAPPTGSEAPDGATPRRVPGASRLGGVALAVLALVWGYNWVAMKVGLRYSQPFTFAALRTFLGALVLFAVLAVLRRPLKPKAFALTCAVGLLQTTGFVGLVMWALASGGAARTSVLAYTMPFWLLLMAWVVLGERLRRLQWVAVGLAFVGLTLVLSPWRLNGLFSSLLAVGASFLWAVSAVVAKLLQKRYAVDLLSLTAWQMLIGSVPLIVIALVTYTGPPVWSVSFVWALAFNVLLANALAWFLWLYALRALSAGTAGLGTLATPVVGVAAAWIQLAERPSPLETIGMALIVAALAAVSLAQAVAGRRAASV